MSLGEKEYCPLCYSNLILDAEEKSAYAKGDLKFILKPLEGHCANCNNIGDIVADTYVYCSETEFDFIESEESDD